MIENMKLSERLYLSKKEGQEIYIDICNLPQHQIDGIRFLYKQFKKKNQGVIFNDPSGCGEIVQVVLFLQAIRTLLIHTTLILCKEAKTTNWIQHFQKWTSFEDHAILLESFNPNRNKMLICVNPMKNIAQFAKRTWSVIIVDDDGENTKEILKTKFKANFKIWITSQDMKENVKMFSQIHSWLKPDDSFNMSDFVSNESNVRDVVTKAILLDAFMQDVVLRRSSFATPVKVEKTLHIIQPKLSRKNKDITGKKIKRSKKTTDTVTDEINTDVPRDNTPKTTEIPLKPLREIEETEVVGMDVETFIGQEKPILETLGELLYTNNSKYNNHDETSRIESDTSIENDISITRTELDSSDNSSICTKDDELNQSGTILKVTDKEEVVVSNNNAIQSQAEDEINFTDIKNNDTTDEKNGAVLMEIESPNKSHKTLDAIVQEMEEKTLKKFKGSFLDSIF